MCKQPGTEGLFPIDKDYKGASNTLTENDRLLNMKLHETIEIRGGTSTYITEIGPRTHAKTISVMKVLGGWIYDVGNDGVFVPEKNDVKNRPRRWNLPTPPLPPTTEYIKEGSSRSRRSKSFLGMFKFGKKE